ncbi:MAG TPA: thioredoxin domain-containing protein, partial [Vicinamibacteria bacterium]|nr:thioredoxin domain-containing protein [Vicinamibacteria bacterium]
MRRRRLTLPLAALAFAGALHGETPPGGTPFDPSLSAKLEAAWQARGPRYVARTRHLTKEGTPRFTNRLFLESSPYLLQHAHNPVNWFPWGDEAFETARRMGRPVLLSIGYSTCHWCHVMEEESFEDLEIARALNEGYVAIKVDREERPDIDAVYLSAVRALTGSGGWPMTVWLTPEREPYFGGTYFPPRDGDRGVRLGFSSLLRQLRQLFAERGDHVAETAGSISKSIREDLAAEAGKGGLPDARVLEAAAAASRDSYDSTWGGWKGAPKFPSSLPVRFLLRHHRRTGDAPTLEMATRTLEGMAAGGIHDQLGGGFHRYAVDERWLVPHFEKMLYDNAQLVVAYLEGWQASGRAELLEVARGILAFVERDLTSPEGAFYSATDADSPGADGRREEGHFFTWTLDEIKTAVGPERARLVEAAYATTAGGNFEGRSVLSAPRPLAEVARGLGMGEGAARRALLEARALLLAARGRRPPPLRDEKIVAAWNGLVIGALARAANALGEPRYAAQAARAAAFVLTHMREGGRLRRTYADGRARHNAYLEDYASLISGLIDLYEATSEPRWLEEAIALDLVLERHYEDRSGGGYFTTSDDHERLLARAKPVLDGAEPSGNSVTALNLLRLHELTDDDRYRRRAEQTLRALSAVLAQAPEAFSELLLAVDFHLDTPKQVVIVTPRGRSDAEPFLARLGRAFVPNRVLVVAAEGQDLAAQARLVPLLEGKVAREGKATAYVCERRVCELPTSDPEVFAAQVARTAPLVRRPAPEVRALSYLMREVPAWREKHACGSCHNNGDGARALFRARRLGYDVPGEAVANTTD